MTNINSLIQKIDACPLGISGWKRFEDVCIEILNFLFVPPLNNPIIQPRTLSGTNRRDAVFPNRNVSGNNNWSLLYKELEARMILFEFKNYDRTEIGKEEIVQTWSYMKDTMGKLAIVICSKNPEASAYKQRNTIFSSGKKQVILFLTKEHLKEMLFIKERGEDPSDLIIDILEKFYLQHE